MKTKNGFFLGLLIFFLSCGNNDSKTDSQPATTPKTLEDSLASIPGIENLEVTDTVLLRASEDMRFDKELFKVKSGKKLKLILKNTSKKSETSMAHNAVVLNKGTEIADFAEEARKAMKEQYIPSSAAASIIAHTKMVRGGDTDSVEFIIPSPGIYDFICSYPGHWGTMQGKIVAE